MAHSAVQRLLPFALQLLMRVHEKAHEKVDHRAGQPFKAPLSTP